MSSAWPVPAAAILAAVLALAAAAPASADVVINEVESNASDGGPDFVEVMNPDGAPADISGYLIKDDAANTFTVPASTIIPAGGFYVADLAGVVGLGNADSALLRTAADAAVDGYTWAAHAGTTFGRCPDGTGAMTSTASPTPNGANNCDAPGAGLTWPGGSTTSLADDVNVFSTNLSGLAYQPSGTASRGVLWAVRNGPSTLFRLVFDGAKWTPDTTNGWGAGKQLLYPGGGGVPDAEGVTLAGGDPNAVVVSTERNDEVGAADISRPAVLRFDVSSPAATLTATRDWNVTAEFPATPDNKGLEAVTWVPDELLVAKGFVVTGGATYNPANYPNHGSGLFFVGVELSGRIIAYALNQTNDSFTRVAEIASGFPSVMSLDYEPESTHLWAVCDDTCGGQSKTLDIAQSGPSDGRFVVTNTYNRPAAADDLNNEGFAITPQAECVNGLKPVIWSDDSNTGGHALREGRLNCTVLPPPDDDDDDTGTGTTTTTTTTTNPVPTPLPPAPQILRPLVRDLVKPVVSRLRASRRSVSFRLSEAARVRITIERRSGRRYRRVRAFTIAARAGARTVSFRGRVAASRLRRGRLRITVVATDAAGNRSAPARKLVPS